MRKTLFAVLSALGCVAMCETLEEAYLRLSERSAIWESDPWTYVKNVQLTSDAVAIDANGKWFADFMAYPDICDTNRVRVVLLAKTYAMRRFPEERGIYGDTNAWMAVADYIGRLRDAKDLRWLDRSQDEVVGTLAGGVRIKANRNPLLDFDVYRAAHTNADYTLWRKRISDEQELQRIIIRAEEQAISTMKNVFWMHGAKLLSETDKEICRSNIVERARLNDAEQQTVFSEQ